MNVKTQHTQTDVEHQKQHPECVGECNLRASIYDKLHSSTHTPGPWKILKESDRQGFKGIGIKAANDALVANLIFQFDDSENANARLIAASPELLMAVKVGIEALINGPERILRQDEQEAIMKMRTAIAKAEGRG